jgi:hypothetical protein
MTIAQLIPKAGFEIIGDQVFSILKTEIEDQKNYMTGDDLNMLNTFYNAGNELNIFKYRFRPLDPADELNGINVWMSGLDENKGSNSRTQKASISFNIDIHVSITQSTGTESGDTIAAQYVNRMGGVIRGILMHPNYKRLGFDSPSIISRRWVRGINFLQPNETDMSGDLIAGQVTFEVEYDEVNLQNSGVLFAGNDTQITADEDGKYKLTTDNP